MNVGFWLFADADHAGEYDNRSTSGCLLVLVGPNTYFPLTAFSKKQTAVAMSSTESEVVSANVSLRAVGLPSSGLWAYLQNAGGREHRKTAYREVCQGMTLKPKKNPMGNIGNSLEVEGCLSESTQNQGHICSHLLTCPSHSSTLSVSDVLEPP